MWATPPSLISVANQYPGTNVSPVYEPPLNEARLIIDDSSADFVISGPCTWQTISDDNSGYNHSYHRIKSDISGSCMATWRIQGDAFAPAGEYDIFAHIPNDVAASLGVEYTIQHNGQTNIAVIVQAAYLANNTAHDAWAYLGRYDFAMNNPLAEFVRLDSQTVIADPDTYVLADAIKLLPADPTPPPVEMIYVSFANDGMAGNVAYADEDILGYDTNSGQWFMFFDGSDKGFAANGVDAFLFSEGNIFFSLNEPYILTKGIK
ncbi:MAG: hypothetical protein H6664_07865 [Ardenticatenaceae bacterium]|nr:hypothetical protein [Ardenticatenaceae bacterium]MCB9004275.1 hypothetical protein [Ardenticatenaceae bacterium]